MRTFEELPRAETDLSRALDDRYRCLVIQAAKLARRWRDLSEAELDALLGPAPPRRTRRIYRRDVRRAEVRERTVGRPADPS